ncbi:thiosulfate dehydrogenase [quinone] large subunit [Flavobacterium sp. 90]|uniref:DoxX family membrane protein n=1 Tax=unclassified Flavobacterium TaxID=196869 RepID=UPI000EAF55EA|nr:MULTISPECIES: DoxX family membrane protein [unclassified Flavobacterium]RKR11741.1 thiosulfate dehydrogenase [quinone] large subunit [Flavobacterium sp. 81]TCK55517.1 thiosulfate dehydrogenase [quinone] large subunit [Flavobacterium sp. 90]
METTSFLLLRLAIAISMFGHGLVRLPKLTTFSNWMIGSFENSMLPKFIVTPFSYILPIAEFAIGLLLLLGLFTKPSLIAGGVVMLALLFGTSMIENWEAVPSQLIHIAFFALLLHFIDSNSWAIDLLIKK